jgi:hypothetical protein
MTGGTSFSVTFFTLDALLGILAIRHQILEIPVKARFTLTKACWGQPWGRGSVPHLLAFVRSENIPHDGATRRTTRMDKGLKHIRLSNK